MVLRLKEPLTAYRIADRRHPIFDGKGAFLYGGRWTSPGIRVIHCSLSLAGAMLETLVHANIGRVPKNQAWIEIAIPKGVVVEEIAAADVPGWDRPDLIRSRACGDAWFKSGRSAVLIVPSAVAPEDRNALINPEHPEAKKVTHSKPRPVIWDERLEKLFGG